MTFFNGGFILELVIDVRCGIVKTIVRGYLRLYFLILICCRRSSARKCQMSRPLLLLHTLHPLGQPGELLPSRPHAELLLVVGVERRAGARRGDHGLHLVRG